MTHTTPLTASPEFLASIGIDPVRFCRWREEFTVCDRAGGEWSGVLREYMRHYLRYLRHPSTPPPDIDPDFDRDAALLVLASEGGLTHAATECVIQHNERCCEEEETELRYFGHFMPSGLALSYVERMLNKIAG